MTWEKTISDLENGVVRSAEKVGDVWVANQEVKNEILNAFRAGELTEFNGFVDKHNLLPQIGRAHV